ncbi:MAG: glycerate kinase [Cyanobacteria bacterium CRU_2_1]|nr:glycerate kinase [Cyanobacteria bacterium RU_5_0]NJR60093.1 glycerate kinase [Cyanobacteria bacterium CRU_2_1]
MLSACLVKQLTPEAQHLLEIALLADKRSKAFGVTSENVSLLVAQRSHFLRSVYPMLNPFCRTALGWNDCSIGLLWDLWLPMAIQLADWRRTLGRLLIVGILGGQGTGKTTLTMILRQILNHMEMQVCCLSIDDLYKTYADRLQLQQVDPRFRWRGPPGTHDIELGMTVLQQLRHADAEHPVAIPRFDKSAWDGMGDRTQAELVTGADIVLFEGWFVGVRPIDPIAFDTAPPPILTEDDRTFARDINTRLQDYLPLWDELDRLIVLYPTDYCLSQHWRQQAEQQMIASGKSGMTNAEINEFVEYFWRSLHPELFITPLLHDSQHVDFIIEINPDHCPSAIYCPDRHQSVSR